MSTLGALTQLTAQMLSRFVDPELAPHRPALLDELRPRPADFARVFRGEAAARARERYEQTWGHTQPPIEGLPGQTSLILFLAIGRDFAETNARARRFPGAYARIAPLLHPETVWASWKYVPPGNSTGMAYDGLVCLEDRWAWFPKPWKLVAQSD